MTYDEWITRRDVLKVTVYCRTMFHEFADDFEGSPIVWHELLW